MTVSSTRELLGRVVPVPVNEQALDAAEVEHVQVSAVPAGEGVIGRELGAKMWDRAAAKTRPGRATVPGPHHRRDRPESTATSRATG